MENHTEEQHENSRPWLAGHRFKPGQSGNPGGRPKGRSLTARLREALDKIDESEGREVAEILVEQLLKIALKGPDVAGGDRQAIKDIFERVDGKVTDKVEVELSADIKGMSDDELIRRTKNVIDPKSSDLVSE